MNKKKLLIILLTFHFIFESLGSKPTVPAWEKENVSFPMMNQEIRRAMTEDEEQTNMLAKQSSNTAEEAFNEKEWSKFRKTTIAIQDRLRKLDFAVQAIPTSVTIVKHFTRIKKNQERIFQELQTAPYAIVKALPMQINFIDELQMTTRLLTGIVLSYGAINQMEKAERIQLLDYATAEIEMLSNQSMRILMDIQTMKDKLQYKKSVLKGYINKDKNIIKNIIRNI